MSGPRLTAVIGLVIAAMCAGIVAAVGPTLEGVHAVVRWTARTSAALFAIAYVARPATQLWPSAVTKGALARRKWIGLGFAVIIQADWAGFVAAADVATAIGTLGFVLIGAMAITSSAAVKRRMSRRAWTGLHRTGMHLFWFVFAATYAGRIGQAPVFAAPTALLVGLAAIRVAAFVRSRRRAGHRVAAAA